MRYRLLPGLSQEVSVIGAGCWAIGGPTTNRGTPIGWDDVDPERAYAGLIRAHELGVTLFDTADVYGLGRSERLLGRLVAEVGRDGVVLSSKVGYFAGTAEHPYHPAQIHHQFDTTLHNLRTDHLDLYYLHSTDFGPDNEYLPGAVAALRKLRERGMIRAVGLRAPHHFAQEWAHGDGPRAAATARWLHLFDQIQPDVVSVRYNLLSPRHLPQETDIFAFARHREVGVLVKQALAQGLILRDPAAPPRAYSSNDHRSRDPAFQPAALAELDRRLAPLRIRFGNDPAVLTRVALSHVLHHAPDSVVLVGFRDAKQITTTLTAADHILDPVEAAAVTTLLDTDERTIDHALHRG
ncbi:aldo/keto reductase [Actinokineospora pegani]|uniref:aldo/keto reductase n=1 Tax=Actinokineospora pegani TaxID=2654637 RepID=UPI0012EA0123|nr:aldo/keto reductase [Actinokineospora pegani]